jgi:hypothetical protein
MNANMSFRKSGAAHPIKYVRAAMLALMVTLIAGLVAPVMAAGISEKDLPFGLQSGLTTAGLDKDGRFIDPVQIVPVLSVAEKDLPFGLQSGLYTARGVGYREPMNLIGGKGLPFGLQSGLETARGVGFRGQYAMIGGKGVPFGLESGLVTAHLASNGAELAR